MTTRIFQGRNIIVIFLIIIDYSPSESRLEVRSENFWYSKINIVILAPELNIWL